MHNGPCQTPYDKSLRYSRDRFPTKNMLCKYKKNHIAIISWYMDIHVLFPGSSANHNIHTPLAVGLNVVWGYP